MLKLKFGLFGLRLDFFLLVFFCVVIDALCLFSHLSLGSLFNHAAVLLPISTDSLFRLVNNRSFLLGKCCTRLA
jgi:hypothetical protein